jgi:hypothetical protein
MRELKNVTKSANLICSGNAFQSFGANTVKYLSPVAASWDSGIVSKSLPEDLNVRVGQ